MAGFLKLALIGEHFSNSVVNVLHYRSAEWLPLQGNPFEDTLAAMDAILAAVKATFLQTHNSNYTLLRAEGVGYDDAYGIATSSPLVRTINEAGTLGSSTCTGSFISANIGLRCGEQVPINGIGTSKRNRGYLSIGPVAEVNVDDYGHIDAPYTAVLGNFAQKLDDTITVLSPAVTLIPVRIHEKYLVVGPIHQTVFRTYSDVKGYTLPRSASVRRSRMSEA